MRQPPSPRFATIIVRHFTSALLTRDRRIFCSADETARSRASLLNRSGITSSRRRVVMDIRLSAITRVAIRIFTLIFSAAIAHVPLHAAPGPVALGGVPGANEGFYRITSDGELLRIWHGPNTWQCHPLFTWGGALAQDSLISGQWG